MADKTGEEYEDINIDINIKDNNSNDINMNTNDNNIDNSEVNELETIAKQLANDYSNYFKIDTSFEKSETHDSIEDLLTHLEEFCGLLEMIRTDNNICLEQVLKNVHQKSLSMNEIYDKIDKLEEFVEMVKTCIDDMEKEMTKAEQLFGNNNKVKKFLSSFMSNSSSKVSDSQRKAKYEPKNIFKTSDYIKNFDLGISEQNNELPKIDSNNE